MKYREKNLGDQAQTGQRQSTQCSTFVLHYYGICIFFLTIQNIHFNLIKHQFTKYVNCVKALRRLWATNNFISPVL